ncbi:MAG: RNA pseudouridine synthase [Bacteriovoracaceae bacterium]
MNLVEIQLLEAESSLKSALKNMGFSGQRIKKYFSVKTLNSPVKKHQILKLPVDFVNHLQINPEYQGSECTILFENDDYLAVHKPRNIHSHPLIYSDTNTVLNYLTEQKKWSVVNINTDNYDRGLLHRLDFETSGVLLLAKKENVLLRFRENFHREMKRKVYLAIVHGDFNQDGEHRHSYLSSGEKGSKQILSESPTAQLAESEIYQLKVLPNNLSLVMVILKTGIRHQIRAQLATLGHPILGDVLYGGEKSERLYLHSWLYQWDFRVEDRNAELFSNFLDLDCALQMASDKLRIL